MLLLAGLSVSTFVALQKDKEFCFYQPQHLQGVFVVNVFGPGGSIKLQVSCGDEVVEQAERWEKYLRTFDFRKPGLKSACLTSKEQALVVVYFTFTATATPSAKYSGQSAIELEDNSILPALLNNLDRSRQATRVLRQLIDAKSESEREFQCRERSLGRTAAWGIAAQLVLLAALWVWQYCWTKRQLARF